MARADLKILAQDFVFVAGIGLIVGLIGAFGAGAFTYLSREITALWLSLDDPDRIGWRGFAQFGFILAATLSAGVLLSSIRLLVKSRWYGPADAILSAQFTDQPFVLKRALLSTLVALISVCGGASVGQYGPLLVFGAAMALAMAQSFKFHDSTRETLIAAGAAAAISAAFGAPLGGMIFAHEVILRHYQLRSFATVALASAMAYGATLLWGGDADLALQMNETVLSSATYVILLFVGVFSGLLALMTMRSVEGLVKFASNLSLSPVVMPLITAILLALVGTFVPQALGIGTETILAAIGGEIGVFSLIMILIAKVLLTGISIAGGFHGGMFSPALVIGALFGALVAILAGEAGVMHEGGLAVFVYAGMGAVVSAVIGGPLSTIIIFYELTRSHDLAAAIAISIVLSNLVSQRLYGTSFFDQVLRSRGYDLSLGREERVLDHAELASLIDRSALVLPVDLSISEAKKRFEQSGQKFAFVLEKDKSLVGQLDLQKLVLAGDDTSLSALVACPPVFYEDFSQLEAIKAFQGSGHQVVGVTDRAGKFVGVIRAASLLHSYSAAHKP